MEHTRHGNNAALSIHILDDAAMRALGFTDCVPEDWYLCRPVSDDPTDAEVADWWRRQPDAIRDGYLRRARAALEAAR